MSYDSKKKEFSRKHIYIVEVLLDFCTLTHGTLPCTATGTGDARCFNTLESTQDLANYTPETKIYRFCESVSPHPVGLDAIPSLDSVSISPSQIDLSGGLGVRASVNLSFIDHPSSDIDVDKYGNGRTYIASERGSFWTKFRARNPDYQNKELRVLSGYLNEDGSFDPANFQTRFYIIDRMDVSAGKATITGKDPLKLASSKKAQAPAPSTGGLSAALASGVTSATLVPAGVGNLEYPASGKVAIKDEVISFTRVADVLTLTRAQNNTSDVDHNANDTVQLCLEFNGVQVHTIDEDLLTNFANVDPSLIPTAAWQAEADTFLSGLLTAIITKPTDVNKLLKELSESMPHYLWWDERTQEVQFTALKAPPLGADVLDMDENIVLKSFLTTDKPEMRKSTIFVNFGQFDPTKRLDEPNNYEQTYVRIDPNSINKFGSSEVKVINSRWITSLNKAAALQLGALIGRRFSDIPREVSFSLDAKDSDVWAGQSRAINHRDIPDFTGAPIDTVFQITSVRERENFDYRALEFTYGDELPEDEGGGDPTVDLVIFGSDQTDVNLRTVFDSLFPAPDASTKAKFIIEGGVKLGSTSVSTLGIDTGLWPAGAVVTLQINVNAHALGKGGNGANADGTTTAEDGGDAIKLSYDLEIINNGIIGSGGGGGGNKTETGSGSTGKVPGGGGAGFDVGLKIGANTITGADSVSVNTAPNNGSTELGGARGQLEWTKSLELFIAISGNGGDLGDPGQSGTTAGGAAGIAIDKNGFVLTETVTGDIRGAVIA